MPRRFLIRVVWLFMLVDGGAPLMAALPSGDFPVALQRLGPAYGQRRHVRLAMAGDRLLAVWEDGRGDTGRVWAMRLDRNGAPIDDVGVPLGPIGSTAVPGNDRLLAVSTDGVDFLVAWTRAALLQLAVVTEGGQARRARDPELRVQDAALVPVGGGYALFYSPFEWYSSPRGLYVAFLDRGGTFVSPPVPVINARGALTSFSVAQTSGSKVLVAWSDSSGQVHALPLSLDDLRRGRWTPPPALPPEWGSNSTGSVRLSRGPSGVLVDWWQQTSQNSRAEYMARLLDDDGRPAGEIVSLGTHSIPFIAWDGAAFQVATFEYVERRLSTRSFGAGGLGASALVREKQWIEGATATLIDGRLLGVWVEGGPFGASAGQIVVSAFLPRAPVGPDRGGLVLVSRGHADRYGARVVRRENDYVAVWRERFADSDRIVFGRLSADGQPLDGAGRLIGTAASPGGWAVATDGRNAMIAWTEEGHVFTTVVDPEGNASSPLRIGSVPYDGFDAVWNGSEYAVMWGVRSGMVAAMRLTADGRPLDAVPREAPIAHGFRALAPIRDGYVAFHTVADFCFPVCIPPMHLWAQAYSREFVPLGPPVLVSRAHVGRWAVASGAEGLLVAFEKYFHYGGPLGLRGVRFDASGNRIDPEGGFAIGLSTLFSAIYATTTGFTVVSGTGAWDVSRDGLATRSPIAFPSSDPRAEYAIAVGGGRLLIVRRRELQEGEGVPSLVGRFWAPARSRAVAAR